MTKTKETIRGTKEIAERLVNGIRSFEATLMELGGMDADTAIKVREFMVKHRMAKQDFCTGRISVKHGAFLDRDVLAKIAAAATA